MNPRRNGSQTGNYYSNKWVRQDQHSSEKGTGSLKLQQYSGSIMSASRPHCSKQWKRTEATITTSDHSSSYEVTKTKTTMRMRNEPVVDVITMPRESSMDSNERQRCIEEMSESKVSSIGNKTGNIVPTRIRTAVQESSKESGVNAQESNTVGMDTDHAGALTFMKRLGNHKLVLNKDQPAKQISAAHGSDMDSCKAQLATSHGVSKGMKAKGHNKLVAQSRIDELMQLKQKLKRKRIDAIEAAKGAGLEHKGPYKLVSENLMQGEEERLKTASEKQLLESTRNRSKGPVKRVKLGDQTSQVKLTDHAYQKTSQNSLTRVVPDDSVPVCPRFSRGILCTKPTCMKRHDVPLEAATPLCSFFQRNGQCLRRDTCPFRHVKVNPHASICPQFSRLGFCEDQACQWKHVRERKRDG